MIFSFNNARWSLSDDVCKFVGILDSSEATVRNCRLEDGDQYTHQEEIYNGIRTEILPTQGPWLRMRTPMCHEGQECFDHAGSQLLPAPTPRVLHLPKWLQENVLIKVINESTKLVYLLLGFEKD